MHWTRINELPDLREKLQTYRRTARNILNRADSEKRDLTDSERKDFSGLEQKMDSLGDEISEIEAYRDREQLAKQNAVRDYGRGAGVREDPLLGRGEVFKSFGEQLQAIVEAGRDGGRVDERLHKIQEHLAPSGGSGSVPSDGGFLVEPTFSSELLRRVYDTGLVAQRCRRIPISGGSNGIKIPAVDETSRATGSRLGGVRVYRADEAASVTATKPKFRRVELELSKLMGLAYATDELIADATMLEAIYSTAFSEEIAFKLDDELFRGTGGEQCLGILNSPALVTVSKETGHLAKTVVTENVINMWARLWARSRRNAVWFVNQDIEPQLHTMTIGVGTAGQPVYMPPGGLSAAPYGTLYTRPVIAVEQCETLGTVGDIVLADMSQYLLIDKSARWDSSMHVRFIYDEMTFRIVYRVNGQPIWNAALTPYKGTATVSPFVVLATRS